MMPAGGLSTKAYHAPLAYTSRGAVEFLFDYERAGIALYDGTQGVNIQLWRCRVRREESPANSGIFVYHVEVSAPNTPWTILFTRTQRILEVSFAFDNNMFPFVVYALENGQCWYWWYDSSDGTQKFTQMPGGTLTPRCCIDDHRESQQGISDVVLAYLSGGSLYVRYQRERYEIAHLEQAGLGANARLVDVGMNRAWRLQFWLRNANPVSSAIVHTDPFVGDIVMDICVRVGLDRDRVGVAELYTETISGYPITTNDSAIKQIEPLGKAFGFDPTEHNRRLRFLKRGRPAVVRFTHKDLVTVSGGSFKTIRVDETKLPIRFDVTHMDPAGGFSRNTQTAYRKSNLVDAKGNETVNLVFAATADQGMTVALKEIKTAWHEQMTYEWSLPLEFAELVPTDVVEYEDEEGTIYRIRIEEKGEDNDTFSFIGKQDGGASVYGAKATGLSLPEPISTTPGLVGPTRVEIINASPFRDQDDELGVYIALAGETSGWYGAALLVSTDEISYLEAYRTETPATLGETEDALPVGDTSVIVVSNFDLESTDATGILNNANRCVIGDEVLQFTTAQHLGAGRWLLQGLVRGFDVHGTEEESHPPGTRFVLVDTGMQFVQAQRWMLGQTLWVKPVSYGTSEEDTIPTEYDFDYAASQTEWAPNNVQAVRALDNTVTVTYEANGRLGTSGNHYQSKYFRGYRIEFSDGFTTDVLAGTYARASTPAGATVRVAGLNEITGVGAWSAWTTPVPAPP